MPDEMGPNGLWARIGTLPLPSGTALQATHHRKGAHMPLPLDVVRRNHLKVSDEWTAQVVQVLDDPDNNRISFFIRAHVFIMPHFFHHAARAIKHGHVIVYYDPKERLEPDSDAYYDPEKDSLITHFNDTDDLYKCSALIHESVHLMNDLRNREKVRSIDDEALAYTAQAMYCRIQGKMDNNFPSPSGNDDGPMRKVYPLAFALADLYLSDPSDGASANAAAHARLGDQRFLDELRRAIRAADKTARGLSGYDGVPIR
jgi:hypothetical protein